MCIRDSIHTGPKEEYTYESMVTMMVGRKVDGIYPKTPIALGEDVLQVKNLSTKYTNVSDVSFQMCIRDSTGTNVCQWSSAENFLLLISLLNRIDSISSLYIFTYLYLYFIALDFPT